MAGLYIHIPFCSEKCGYCAFYSVVGCENRIDMFLDALDKEAVARTHELSSPLSTIYIGGGTPSLLSPTQFEQLDRIIKQNFKIYPDKIEEYTIEVNPDNVDIPRIQAWRNAGVTRISMGVQSMIPQELQTIGRRHTALEASKVYQMLRASFSNISLDIIFGLPGQTMESWKETVHQIIDMYPEHISAYSLTFEERTRFSKMLKKGEITEIEESLSLDMFHWVCHRLAEAGYEHYEISNFARSGKRALHNSSYWNGSEYLGLGPGASSYDGYRTRKSNPPSLKEYIFFYTDGGENSDYVESEYLSRKELTEEYILTRLRTSEGIDLEQYGDLFGKEEAARITKVCRRIGDKWINCRDGVLRLTQDGFFISDEIIVSLLPD